MDLRQTGRHRKILPWQAACGNGHGRVPLPVAPLFERPACGAGTAHCPNRRMPKQVREAAAPEAFQSKSYAH
jgi:hypothetical protein